MPTSPAADAAPCAVILAAGAGRRLGAGEPEHARVPKALLEFGGRSLLARHVEILRSLGISAITVVIGFKVDHMRAALGDLDDELPVETVVNPHFRDGSVVSLWSARAVHKRPTEPHEARAKRVALSSRGLEAERPS